MKILVYGAGAVGGYVGTRLAHSGHAVTLVNRPATAERINAQGLTVSEGEETIRADVTAVASVGEAFAAGQRYDLILLGMKSYDLATAAEALAAVCLQPETLITLQNGIGVERPLIRRFGADHVIAGSLTTPVSKAAATHLVVEHSGRGLGLAPTQAGQDVGRWTALFAEAGITTIGVGDYEAMKWSKALLNIVGNATAAILDMPPGDVYRSADLFNLEMRMLRETLAVMEKRALAVVNLPGSPARQLALGVRWVPRLLLQPVLTRIVAQGRGDKMPSFHIDLVAGRGKSEVIYHNGAIAEAGKALGVATPVNAVLNDLLLQITTGAVQWSSYAGHPARLLAAVKARTTAEEMSVEELRD